MTIVFLSITYFFLKEIKEYLFHRNNILACIIRMILAYTTYNCGTIVFLENRLHVLSCFELRLSRHGHVICLLDVTEYFFRFLASAVNAVHSQLKNASETSGSIWRLHNKTSWLVTIFGGDNHGARQRHKNSMTTMYSNKSIFGPRVQLQIQYCLSNSKIGYL